MKVTDFFRSRIRMKIFFYLKDHNNIFRKELVKKLNHTQNSIYDELDTLLRLELIEENKEDKPRGHSRKRYYYSISDKGKLVIEILKELSPLIS